jgi:hypothetical protein
MKINKLTAVGATLTLAVGSVLGLGTAATAVEVPVGSIVAETNPYPVEQWFLGNPQPTTAPTQDASGLTLTGRTQLLYGRVTPVASGAAFTTLISGASFVATGTATFQVPVFFDGTANTEFTTLRPAVPGSPTTTSEWISSQAVAGLPAGTPLPFATIAAAFDAAGDAEVLAFGVIVDPGTTAVLSSVTWAGTTWTFATPAAPVTPPVAPVAPVAPPAAPAAPATPVTGAATFTG